MHTPWHLKYRPSKLNDLVGQSTIQSTLSNAIAFNKIANAYLLEGGRGTGKTSTARILAKSLNCLASESPTVTPCGDCLNCRAIESGNSMDTFELDAASNNGVDDIRKIIESAQFSRMQGRYRVFILDEVQMLSKSGQAALLKTLEQPPEGVVFFLCTTDPEKLSEPVISRCLHLRFGRISSNAIAKRLLEIAKQENLEINREAVDAIAQMSKGGMRDALQTLEQLAQQKRQITANDVRTLFKQASVEQLTKIIQGIFNGDIGLLMMESQSLIEQGLDPRNILQDLLAIYRDLYVMELCGYAPGKASAPLIGSLNEEVLSKLLPFGSRQQIEDGLRGLQKAESELRYSPNAGVWLEICLLRLSALGVF